MWWMLLVAVLFGVLIAVGKLAKSYQKKLEEKNAQAAEKAEAEDTHPER